MTAIERAVSGVNLIGAMLSSPLVGVRKRWPEVEHAIEMVELCRGWKRGTFTSACGLTGLRLLGGRYEVDGRLRAVLWPPEVKSLPAGSSRCSACHFATGRKRPRTRWTR